MEPSTFFTFISFGGAECLTLPPRLCSHEAQQQLSTEKIMSLLQAADVKRKGFLQARSLKFSERVQHAKIVAAAHRRQALERANQHKQSLNEQLQLAEEKRTAMLQQQVATCAASVQHAREVCSRARQERQSNLNQRLQRARRRASALSHQRAARKIQIWWRQLKLNKLVEAFRGLDLSISKLTRIGFEQSSALVVQSHVLRATSNLLRQIAKSSSKFVRVKGTNYTRTFLSAFIMRAFPDYVLSDPHGAVEKNLQEAAEVTLERFDKWLNTTNSTASHYLLESLVGSMNIYFARFEEWRSQDANHLMERLMYHLRDLDAMRELIRGSPKEQSLYLPQIISERERLLHQIQIIGGQAAVDQALGQLNEQQEVKPTDAADSTGDARPKTRSPSPLLHEAESGQFMGDLNDQLIHEVLLDPSFTVPDPHAESESESILSTINQHMQNVFWDQVRSQLLQGDMSIVSTLVTDMREGLLSMVQSQTARTRINDVLDDAVFKQQLQHGTLDLPRYLRSILNIIATLCAPVRDDSIAALRQTVDHLSTQQTVVDGLVDVLRRILLLIESMRVDLLNYHLQQARPVLLQHGAAYERQKFRKDQISLQRTRAWLLAAKNSAQQQTALEIIHEAFISVISQSRTWSNDTLPETLMMDQRRIMDIQNKLQEIVIVAAILLFVRNGVKEMYSANEALEKLRDSIIVLLRSDGTHISQLGLHICSAVNQYLQQNQLPCLTAPQEQWLQNMTNKTLSLDDAVFKMLQNRTIEVMRNVLRQGAYTTAISTSLPRSGLDWLGIQLRDLASQLLVLVQHNKTVFSTFYDEIIASFVHV